jgi:hypothetical protein
MEFEPSNGKYIEEVLLQTQQYFVFQLAHRNTSIKSDDGNPWIRCVGFMQTLDGARDLARKAFEEGNKMETRIMPVGKVFLAGAKKYESLDLPRREEEQIKANKMYNEWIEKRKKVHQEIEEKAKAKEILPEPEMIKKVESNIATSRPPTPIPEVISSLEKIFLSSLDLASDTVWACGIIPDEAEENEPALLPLFSASTVQEIQPLVKEAAKSQDLLHIDIFVGSVGEWLPISNPQAEEKLYHNPLLQQATKEIRWIKQETSE